jgi:hypothetical protein
MEQSEQNKREMKFLLAIANKPFTSGERAMLEALAKDENAELEYCKGGGWWIGEDQVSGRVAWSLIRMTLVSRSDSSEAHSPGAIERYAINTMGLARLAGNNVESVLHMSEDE